MQTSKLAEIAGVLLVLGMPPAGEAQFADEPAAETPSVTQYHNHASRNGIYFDTKLTRQGIRAMPAAPFVSVPIEGPVYAQPLYLGNGPHGRESILIATEKNEILMLDPANGAVTWRRALGQAVPLSSLPCGNIDPLGVTGTPIVDLRSRTVYVDAMLTEDAGKTQRHRVFALSVDDGAIRPGWPVDVEQALKAQGVPFQSRTHNQRGALALFGGRLYVPFGGHFGDCGDYHGVVVGIDVGNPLSVQAWRTESAKGGIWAPGGVSSDGQSLFVVTGNTEGATRWGGGDAVLRLAAGPRFSGNGQDFFAPLDWMDMDRGDRDLGSSPGVPFDLPGTGSGQLIVTMGKDGKAYLLDRKNLGGISAPLASFQASSGVIITSPAVYPTAAGVFVALNTRGASCPSGTSGNLLVLKVNGGSKPSFSPVFCAAQKGRGSPIVSTTDGAQGWVLWALSAQGDNRLQAFDGLTGESLFSSEPRPGLHRFHVPIIAKGRVFVVSDQRLEGWRTE